MQVVMTAPAPMFLCSAKCLRNRHGEDCDAAEASNGWWCPCCRGSCGAGCVGCCNCGLCRKKVGFEAELMPHRMGQRCTRVCGSVQQRLCCCALSSLCISLTSMHPCSRRRMPVTFCARTDASCPVLCCRWGWSPHTRWCAWHATLALTTCTTTWCTWSQVRVPSLHRQGATPVYSLVVGHERVQACRRCL